MTDDQGSRPDSRGRFRRPQFGLRTALLLVVAVAVWLTDAIHRREVASLEGRLPILRDLGRELIVDDPGQAALVKLDELWSGDNRWEVYLPEGRPYRICLATRGVAVSGIARTPAATRPFPAGRHVVSAELRLADPAGGVVVTWDGGGRLEFDEAEGWYPGAGSTSYGGPSRSEQQSAAEPLVLKRTLFSRVDPSGGRVAPSEPAEGVLLWIEPAVPP